MKRKKCIILIGIILVVCCACDGLAEKESNIGKNVDIEKLINVSGQDFPKCKLYTCLNGVGKINENSVIDIDTDEGYVISDEDISKFQEYFYGYEMSVTSKENYTYNVLIEIDGESLMFNTLEMLMFFVCQDKDNITIYEMTLTDKQSSFIKEIEKQYTESDENYVAPSIVSIVDFSNVNKMDVKYSIMSGKYVSEAVTKMLGSDALYLLDDEEKSIFRESFGELRVEQCFAESFEYDCVISVGEKLIMLDVDKEMFYLLYDVDKEKEVYYATLTDEQIRFVEMLIEKHK